ncbi:putative nucleic acid-binding Zn ribbon protein [Brevibacterium sanguinis]|uniref:Nucleic acid-binding Zn ribbon protein n=2 Tax=Brevibacterium TaxID=1696 RepID=A0ABX9GT13_9MICO|nr:MULTISPECIES: DciA family protein [Brevibacterium]RBP67252.1 putative nucleic acid-binding Zn ribbon protein [Brevibacterium sanguinis]RBP73777.1 putative nucleic acid-binding Zn ribbon protein [Brevibacterium celere]
MSGIIRDEATPVAALEALDRVRRMEATESRYVPSRRRSRVRGEVTYTSAGKDKRDPATISSALGSLISSRGWSSSIDIGKVLGRWPDLVGAQVAQHCTPVDFSPPLLVIAADSTTWATQLRVLKPSILDALETGLGSRTITEIEIRGPRGRTFKKGRRTVAGRGPRDTYG